MASNQQAKPSEQLTPNQQALVDLENAEKACMVCWKPYSYARNNLRKSLLTCLEKRPYSDCKEMINLSHKVDELEQKSDRNESGCKNACNPLWEKTLLDKWLGKLRYRKRIEMDGVSDYVQCCMGCLQIFTNEIEQLKVELKNYAQEDSVE